MTCKWRTHGIPIILISAVLLIFAGALHAFAGMLPETAAVSGGTLLGDANNDGAVTISDITAIQLRVAEFPDAGDFSEQAADADGSGDITIDDASLLQQWLAEFETAYPIGEPIQTAAETTTEPATQFPTDNEGWGREIFQP